MFKKLLYALHNLWAAFWFIIIYLILFPFIFICIQVKSWHKYGNALCNLWADLFFPIAFMPCKISYEEQPNRKQNYVFVANHFSYLDVAVGMKVVRHYFSYMGKASVKNIPLLGYMFAKLHIQVDRSEKDSRAKALLRSKRALEEGRSLFIMPEGGILSENIPYMHKPFKDGAFTLAKEAGVPILPIAFLNLDEIMPKTSIKWGIPKIKVLKPVSTKGKDIESLKTEVYNAIQYSILVYKNENRDRNY